MKKLNLKTNQVALISVPTQKLFEYGWVFEYEAYDYNPETFVKENPTTYLRITRPDGNYWVGMSFELDEIEEGTENPTDDYSATINDIEALAALNLVNIEWKELESDQELFLPDIRIWNGNNFVDVSSSEEIIEYFEQGYSDFRNGDFGCFFSFSEKMKEEVTSKNIEEFAEWIIKENI